MPVQPTSGTDMVRKWFLAILLSLDGVCSSAEFIVTESGGYTKSDLAPPETRENVWARHSGSPPGIVAEL